MYFARTEGRFRRHFQNGQPAEALQAGQQDRLAHWHTLQELAGLRSKESAEKTA